MSSYRDRVFARVDDPEFTGDRIAGHEICEGKIRDGKISYRKAMDYARQKLGNLKVNTIVNFYADIHSDTKELVCDAAGNMNRLSSIVEERPELQNLKDALDEVLFVLHEYVSQYADLADVPELENVRSRPATDADLYAKKNRRGGRRSRKGGTQFNSAVDLADLYRGKNLAEDASIYSYDFLTSLPDMIPSKMPDMSSLRDQKSEIDASKAVSLGMKNAKSVGYERNGKTFVVNRYTGITIRVTTNGILHGINGDFRRLATNARLGAIAGDIVKNAVPINGLQNKAPDVDGTYAMAAYSYDDRGREFVSIITIENKGGSVLSIDSYDTLHAMSGRQKNGSQADTKSQSKNSIKATSISIAEFLDIVKATHQSILSDDVLSHYGEAKNVKGTYYGQAKFSSAVDVRKLDTEYLELAKDPEANATRLQEMVDEAAKAAMPDSKIRDANGRLEKLYHGTTEMFYTFDTSISGGKNGTAEGFGIYLSSNPEVTKAYGDRQIALYADIKKPARYDKKTITPRVLASLIKDTCLKEAQRMVEDGEYDTVEEALRDTWISNYVYTYDMTMQNAYNETARTILQANGNDMEVVQEVMTGMSIRSYEDAATFYRESLTPITGIDGFITEWENSELIGKSEIVLAQSSNQLKSADPVTYDDAGNVIPLSERFNSETGDIRFSRVLREIDQLRRENDQLRNVLRKKTF